MAAPVQPDPSLRSFKALILRAEPPNQLAYLQNACVAAALAALAIAHPVEKRQDVLPPVDSMTDELVAQLALYLEHLELSLYTGGYENFTVEQYTAAGFPPGFRENVGVIAQVWNFRWLHFCWRIQFANMDCQ